MRKNTTNISRAINIAIVLMSLSVVFYYFSIFMMSQAQKIPMLELINRNPILGLDLLSVCGRVFGVLILIKLKNTKTEAYKKQNVIISALLALSQLLIQNYLTALILCYLAYLYYPSEGFKKEIKLNLKELSPTIAVLTLHVFILLLQLRIHAVALI